MLMMAIRLMHFLRGGLSREGQDRRTAEAVLTAAAKRIEFTKQSMTAHEVWCQLEAVGVFWAWQMANMSDADWDKLGVPLGLKTAAKAELLAPSESAKPGKYRACDELSPRMRRFLLLPDEDGSEAKPLREMAALFLGLLSVHPSERQSLLLVACELLALVSGLFISAPLDLRGDSSPKSKSLATNMWEMEPSRADAKDAILGLIFLVNFNVVVMAVGTAMYVVTAGAQASDAFTEGVMCVIGASYAFFIGLVFFAMQVVGFWQFFDNAASPYPMLFNVVVVMLFNHIVCARKMRFLVECCPLEVYHCPRWAKCFLAIVNRGARTGMAHLLTETSLRAAAEQRAAILRARMKLDTGDNGAIPGTPVLRLAPTGLDALDVEPPMHCYQEPPLHCSL